MDPPPTQEEEKARKTSGKGMCPVELRRELEQQREAAAKAEAKEEQRQREERLEEHAAVCKRGYGVGFGVPGVRWVPQNGAYQWVSLGDWAYGDSGRD